MEERKLLTHYIIMSSSYSNGIRIALHYVIDELVNIEKLNLIVPQIIERCGKDVSISTHSMQLASLKWEDVVKKDSYFKDVVVVNSVDEFIDLINKDRVLLGIDVAKYVICKVKCTHLKLEKLVYFCFAEYLAEYNKELYIDEIYAYKYGPVTKSVYDRYKSHGYNIIEKEDEIIKSVNQNELPSRSRLLFAKDGIEKVNCIDKTLKKYGNFTASKLVELTHNKSTPWDVSGRGEIANKVITRDVILKYHCNEIK